MHQVLAHIDQHLDTPLELAELAAVACFSPFHFHRTFSAWMGEPLGEYVRRRRLEVAAVRLLAQPRIAVLEIALAVGFGSNEALAHAFKARFGCSPTAWRVTQKSKRDQVMRKLNQVIDDGSEHHVSILQTTMENTMNRTVTIVERQPVTVAYMRVTGPYGFAIKDFWQQQVAPWMVVQGLLGNARYGIGLDDPLVTASEKCRYDACVEIDASFKPSAPALKQTIPGGKYAVLPFRFPQDDIPAAWEYLLRDWLPESGYQLDARPLFEHYPAGGYYDEATGAFDGEVCVPVTLL